MKKTPDFTLYWVSDTINEDWFVIVPCHVHDTHMGSYMAEWFHCEYEDLNNISAQDSTICYEAMADDVMAVPFSMIPATMKKKMKEEFALLNGKMQVLKEIFFGEGEFEEFENAPIKLFKPKIRKMFEKELNNDFDKIMEWCWTNLEPDEDNYLDKEFDGKYFKSNADYFDALEFYGMMLKWQTIGVILDTGKGYAPVHGQIDLLTNLGFTIIDNGDKSSQRVVVYNGQMYTEGEMESK
jgi:hypothetical protein